MTRLAAEGRYVVSVTAVIGPVKAKYDGHLVLRDLDPPQSYRIEFEAQIVAAGFGKGGASVVLVERDAATELQYIVQLQVGGRLAQIGSRLIDAASRSSWLASSAPCRGSRPGVRPRLQPSSSSPPHRHRRSGGAGRLSFC